MLIGNPTQNGGPFFDAFRDPSFNKIHISAFDVLNAKERRQVILGRVTHEWVEQLIAKYGEDRDLVSLRAKASFAPSRNKGSCGTSTPPAPRSIRAPRRPHD